jgi:glycosyltransferase involved in cell wall biosynthesis
VQLAKSFEVLIADDGSSEENVEKISCLIKNFPFPVRHIWHEDMGWRKNTILNRAAAASFSDYLIFIDGDCLLHTHFVKEHLANRQSETVLTGRRVYLSPSVSHYLVQSGNFRKLYSLPVFFRLFYDRYTSKSSAHLENALYLGRTFLRRFINKKDRGVLGSNFSLYRSDLLRINGFDEQYTAPYVGEDTDLEYRLRQAGMKVKTLKHLAIQYHLFHPRQEKNTINEEIFKKTRSEGRYYAEKGIDQYL